MANESADVKGKTLLGILALGFFSALYSIYGGLTAVAWTDVIQVIFLIGGGLFTTYIVLDFVSDGSVFKGFGKIVDGASDHFNMIFEKGETMIPNGKGGKKDAFIDLPGLAVVFGAMWLTNLGYWGFNQYIIQKGLAAKSMKEARQGLVFAGFLKILVPLVVVIPGIAAYYILNTDDPYILQGLTEKFGSLDNVGQLEKSDSAYPWLLRNFIPVGIRGLAFAALVAAIISSLASMINSTSTIFTIDIYKPLINKNASEKQLVRIGRIVAFVALIISSLVAQPLLGGFDQVFQYIQEYTGLIYPGVAVVFSMGLFWKRASTSAAIAAALCTFPFGFGAKFLFPGMPFLLRMGYVFIALVAVASLFIFFDKKGEVEETEETKLSEGIVKMMLGASRIFAGVSVVSLLLAIASLTNIAGLGSLLNIGGEAFMFFGSAMAMIGVVLYTNALGKTADSKAIRYTPELFKSDLFFNLGSLGIILIVGALYVIFW
ncbi:MAG: sodium/solute symporter [Bacteroidia bacterium]|nr:sodium/solute symporter [Bacteroidia bacterium]